MDPVPLFGFKHSPQSEPRRPLREPIAPPTPPPSFNDADTAPLMSKWTQHRSSFRQSTHYVASSFDHHCREYDKPIRDTMTPGYSPSLVKPSPSVAPNSSSNRSRESSRKHSKSRSRSSRRKSDEKLSPRQPSGDRKHKERHSGSKPRSVEAVDISSPIEIVISSDEGTSTPPASVRTADVMNASKTPPPFSFDPKRDTIFYCTPCRQLLSNTAAFEEHISEAEHKKRMNTWREIRSLLDDPAIQNSYSKGEAISQPAIDGCKELIIGADQVIEIANRKLQVAEQWICRLCSVLCDTRSELISHVTGVEHLANHVIERRAELMPSSTSSGEDWLDAVRAAAKQLASAEGKGQMKSLTRQRVVPLDGEEADDIADRELMAVMEMFFSTADTAITDFVPALEVKEVRCTSKKTLANPGFEFLVEFHSGAPSPNGSIAYCVLCRATLMKNAKEHCFSSAHCYQLSKLLPATGLSKGKTLVITRRLKGGEWKAPQSGKRQLVKITAPAELFVPLATPIFEEIVQNLDLLPKATKVFESNMKEVHASTQSPKKVHAEGQHTRSGSSGLNSKRTNERTNKSDSSSGGKRSSHFLRRADAPSAGSTERKPDYPAIDKPLIETPERPMDGQRVKSRSRSRQESSQKSPRHSRKDSRSHHATRHSQPSHKRPGSPVDFVLGTAVPSKRRQQFSHETNFRSDNCDPPPPSHMTVAGSAQPQRLEPHVLQRLDSALRSIGVDLGRPLTYGDVVGLRDQFGPMVIDRLIAQVSDPNYFIAGNPALAESAGGKGPTPLENLVVRKHEYGDERLVVRKHEPIALFPKNPESTPRMHHGIGPESSAQPYPAAQALGRLGSSYSAGNPNSERPPQPLFKTAEEKAFDMNRSDLTNRLKKIVSNDTEPVSLLTLSNADKVKPAAAPAAQPESMMERLQRRLEQDEQFRRLQERRDRLEQEERKKVEREQAAAREKVEREEEEIRRRLANSGPGYMLRASSTLVQNPLEGSHGGSGGDPARPANFSSSPWDGAASSVLVQSATQPGIGQAMLGRTIVNDAVWNSGPMTDPRELPASGFPSHPVGTEAFGQGLASQGGFPATTGGQSTTLLVDPYQTQAPRGFCAPSSVFSFTPTSIPEPYHASHPGPFYGSRANTVSHAPPPFAPAQTRYPAKPQPLLLSMAKRTF